MAMLVYQRVASPKLTVRLLKFGGQRRQSGFLLDQKGQFSGAFAVSFREANPQNDGFLVLMTPTLNKKHSKNMKKSLNISKTWSISHA